MKLWKALLREWKELRQNLFSSKISLHDVVSIFDHRGSNSLLKGEIVLIDKSSKAVKVRIVKAEKNDLIGADLWLHISQVRLAKYD